MAADVLEARTSPADESEIAYLAYHDALTGLPNRRLLEAHLSAALDQAGAAGHAVALLFIDLNNFKVVNDSLGHDVGDELLHQAAERLLEVVRYGDLLARQGGDEFLFMVPAIAASAAGSDLAARAEEVVATCAERILATLQEPFAVGEAVLHIGASVGASVYPFDARDAAALSARADAAMYAAKESEGGWSRYDPDRVGPLERLSFAGRMRRGLGSGEFSLHYQPVVELASGRACCVEALARWTDPARGPVAPGDFIPVAEQTGVIGALGDWALDALCAQVAAWEREGLRPRVGVNVSPVRLRRPGFAAAFAATLDRHGVDPASFMVELTESAWALESCLPALAELRAAGSRVAIDDFGAGYSSLARLHELPVDVIKLDRAFLRGIPDSPQPVAIVTAVLQLARACGCDVVVEGIETEAQRAFLAASGVGRGQGFHLGRPAPADAMTERMRAELGAATATGHGLPRR